MHLLDKIQVLLLGVCVIALNLSGTFAFAGGMILTTTRSIIHNDHYHDWYLQPSSYRRRTTECFIQTINSSRRYLPWSWPRLGQFQGKLHISEEQKQEQKEKKLSNPPHQAAIYTVLLSTTLNLLGFTLTSPLNPALGQHFNLPLGASFGSLTSAYPTGMLVGQLLWAKMSDSLGRKRILMLSLLGGGLGLSLQSWAIWSHSTLHFFLATRVFTGVFSGVAPVTKAYLADLGEELEQKQEQGINVVPSSGARNIIITTNTTIIPSSRQGLVAKYLAWRDAASTLAYIIGPALGGSLFEGIKNYKSASLQHLRLYNRHWMKNTRTAQLAVSNTITTTTPIQETTALALVIGMAGFASILASLAIAIFVQDRIPTIHKKRQQSKGTSSTAYENEIETESWNESKYYTSCPLGTQLWTGVATVCLISFLYHVSDSTFFAFYPALLQNQFGLDARSVGMSFTGFACISFLFSSMSISSRMIQSVGVVNTCILGLTSLGTGLTALSFVGAKSGVSLGGDSLRSIGSFFFPTLSIRKYLMWLSAGVYFSGVPLYGPTVPLMLLMCVPSHQRGAIMGLDGAVNTIARIISPIFMGEVYQRYGAQSTFQLAGFAAFSSAAIALVRRISVMNGRIGTNRNDKKNVN